MITDLNDLEPLLGQYEPGLILVGPVLSFSIGGHRYFHVAANGSKIYETIGLGTFENEVDAKTQRENIIAILKGRFAKVQIFDSHYDMARAVNDRWPNEETARILAFAALLTEPETGKAAQGGSIGEDSDAQIVPSGHGLERADDEAREPVDLANDATPPSAPPQVFEVAEPAQSLPPSHMSADAPSPLDSAVQLTTAQQQHPGGNDDILGISLSEVALRPPNQSQGAVELSAPSTGSAPSVDRPPRVQQDNSRRNEDDLASIRRALSPSRQSQTSPQPPAVAARSPSSRDRPVTERRGYSERRDDLLMTMASFTRPDIYQKDFAAKALDPSDRTQKAPRLMGVRNLASLLVLMGAVGGASAFITWAMLRSITPRVTDEVGTIAARQPAAVPTPSTLQATEIGGVSTQAKSVPNTRSEQQEMTTEATPQFTPTPVASPPPASKSSREANTQSKTVADSPPERQAVSNETTPQVKPAPAVMAPSTPAPRPSGGTGPEAKPAPNAHPEQQAMIKEPAPDAMPPAPAPQPSGGASPQQAMLKEPAPATGLVPQPSGRRASPQAKAAVEVPEQPPMIKEPAAAMAPTPQPSGGGSPQAKLALDEPEQQAMLKEPAPEAVAPVGPVSESSGAGASPQAKAALDSRPEEPTPAAIPPAAPAPPQPSEGATPKAAPDARRAPVAMAPAAAALEPSGGGGSLQAKPTLGARPEQQSMIEEPAPDAAATARPAPQPSASVSPQAKPAPDVRPEQQAMTGERTLQLKPAPAAIAPPASTPAPQSTEAVSPQAKPALETQPEQQSVTGERTLQLKPAPAAIAPPASTPAPQSAEAVSPEAKPAPETRPEQQAMTNERTILQLKPAPTTVPTSAAAPQSAEAVSPQAKPATDTRPEQQAMTGERTPELKPSPAGIAPPASTPAPQSAEAVSPEAKPASETRPEQRQAVTTPVTRPQPSPAQGGGTALRLDSEEITALIDRGSDLLKRGDLASARLLLRRAADAGSADAALMLGSTFDPLTIEQLGAIGVAPDVARARQWYQRAVELGSDAAAQRLANLKN